MTLLLPTKWLQSYVDQLKLVRNTAIAALDTQSARSTLLTVARIAPLERPKERTKHLYMSKNELLANAELVVTAGTDTSASVLPATLFLLAQNIPAMAQAKAEVRAFSSPEHISFGTLSRLSYLTACVTEALRLYNPVPEGLPRVVPEPGHHILGHWLPGGTFCQVSTCASSRSSSYFTDPDSFVPERWLPSHPLHRRYAQDEVASFRPFSVGPRDCIGQNFAMTSIRLTLALLLFNFDVQCASDDNWVEQPSYLLWQRRALYMYLSPVSEFAHTLKSQS